MSSFVKGLLYLMMIISIVRMLSSSKEYDKYIKFFISLLFVVSILSPVLSIVKGEEVFDFLKESYAYNESYENNILDKSTNFESLVLDEYKRNTLNNIKDELNKKFYIDVNLKIEINDDVDSNEYASIKKIYLTLNKEDENKVNKIKNYLVNTYKVDKENINIRVGSVTE